MKKRILFVDDEPNVLDGLRNRLRRQRRKWEMSFVVGGKQALDHLATHAADVIVSDMRMPGMDGASLLKQVQREHPHVVRIVLSGHAELAIALRVVPVAQQFLAKPCDVGLLENVIERACNLSALVSDEVVRKSLGRIETLPSLPRVYSELMAALADDSITTDAVARVLQRDMGMSAKLLQLANSALFRLPRRITSIAEAVAYLGFDTIKQLTLAASVFVNWDPRLRGSGLSLAALQQHSLLVGTLASRMFSDQQRRGDAFTAGMLHDIGKLLLAAEFSDHLALVAARMRESGEPMHVVEQELCGITHAEIGGYLLGLWGLPFPIVEAVANSHHPEQVEQVEFDLPAAVHLADTLCAAHSMPVFQGVSPALGEPDMDYLARLGVGQELERWRQSAAEIGQDGSASGRAPRQADPP